jgi:hypothetical protein
MTILSAIEKMSRPKISWIIESRNWENGNDSFGKECNSDKNSDKLALWGTGNYCARRCHFGPRISRTLGVWGPANQQIDFLQNSEILNCIKGSNSKHAVIDSGSHNIADKGWFIHGSGFKDWISKENCAYLSAVDAKKMTVKEDKDNPEQKDGRSEE